MPDMAAEKIDLVFYLHVLYMEHADIDPDNPNYATSQAICNELASAIFVAETGLNPLTHPAAVEAFAEQLRLETEADLKG